MSTASSRVGAALLGLLGLTGCNGSTSSATATPDDLARAVVGYLASGDFDGYLADTVITSTQVFDLCPATQSFNLDVSSFRKHFDACREDFDFTGARVTAVSPKLEATGTGDEACGNDEPVNGADSIDVTVEAAAGTYQVQLGDSVETADGWRQAKHLRCSGGTPNCDAYALSVEICCAEPSADQAQCATMKATIQKAKELASELDTDCGVATYDCPYT